MKQTSAILFLSLSLCVLSSCGGSKHNAVIVAGSTSVQPYAEVLAEGYAIQHPDAVIDVQGGGSSAGIRAAQSGAADIGMSSRELTADELDMWSVEIAKDGLVLITHPGNPIDNLSLEQARGIYAGTITQWSEIGGNDAKIHLITREEGSGTRSAFESLVMGDSYITPKAIVQDSNGSVRQLVSGDVNSIGFISMGLLDSSVKALRLDGVAATWENIMNGSYTLHRPFIFVSAEEPEGLAEQFVRFTLSSEGRRLLVNEGLVIWTEEAE